MGAHVLTRRGLAPTPASHCARPLSRHLLHERGRGFHQKDRLQSCTVALAAGLSQEAINMLPTIPYDMVLMDCQMPDMDGFEATLSVRQEGSKALNPHIPIMP